MKNISITLLLFSMYSLSLQAQDSPVIGDQLEFKWSTEGLDVPESVLLVPEKGILYVSNVGAQNPSDKNGSGFISILTTEGKIKTLKWCTDLNSPKGMAISGNKLFVSEVDKVAEIDLSSGKKAAEYPVEGAKFLNDVAADSEGKIYISDSGTGTVYLLYKGKISLLVQSDDFNNINGLLFTGGSLYAGTGKDIVMINPKTKAITTILENTGGVDGIGKTGKNAFVFSDWPGTIHTMTKGKDMELIYDSHTSDTMRTADFYYDSESGFIYLPTFFGNSVVCYQLNE